MNITAKELSGLHIGKNISVIVPGFNGETVTGEIWHVYQMYEHTEIIIPGAGTVRVPRNTPIAIQEGQ